MVRQGIPTTYVGTRFRSRLEARWAHLFDLIGWKWEYEPFDLDGYVPDFAILGQRPLIIEVKPATSLYELRKHIPRLTAALSETEQTQRREFLLVGASPLLPGTWSPHRDSAGLLGQLIRPDLTVTELNGPPDNPDDDQEPTGHWVDEATWGRCHLNFDNAGLGHGLHCDRISVTHTQGDFTKYPCAHYTGGDSGRDCDDVLSSAWAHARNATQWRP